MHRATCSQGGRERVWAVTRAPTPRDVWMGCFSSRSQSSKGLCKVKILEKQGRSGSSYLFCFKVVKFSNVPGTCLHVQDKSKDRREKIRIDVWLTHS